MAVLSSVLLLGSILLSYAENGYALALPSTGTQTITAVPQVAMESGVPYFENTTPGDRPTDIPTYTLNPDCIPPEGYVAYFIKPGDTLASLARRFSASEKAILEASCFKTVGLSSISLVAGSVLYVPEVQLTAVVTPCRGAPYGWVPHYVRPNDTLFTLALITQVTVAELQAANCMGNSTKIITGQLLRLPFNPYSPPVLTTYYPPTVTPSSTATPAPFILPSWTPVTPVTIITAVVASPSTTPDAIDTSSPSPTASDTPAIQLPSNTQLPTVTNTPIPPPTNTPVPPPTKKVVPPPSDTPVPPPTDTPKTLPRESTPNLPEAIVGVGQQLCPPFWTLLTD
jgi:LysM repeat protein